MKIYVTAKPKSKTEFVKKLDENHFQVAVKELPEDGKANTAIIKALGKFFSIPVLNIRLVSGESNKLKIIEII